MPRRRYTEQQFRDAVADPAVTTIADLCRALGIVPRGGNYETVRSYAADLGLDLSRLEARRHPDGRFRSTWTCDDLARALYRPGVTTLADLCTELGLVPSSANYARLQEAAKQAGIDVGHLRRRRPGRPSPTPAATDTTTLTEAFRRAHSQAQMLRLLGMPVTTSTRRWLRQSADDVGLDLDDLPGQGWSRGATRPRTGRPLESYLVRGRLVDSNQLRRRLIAEGVREHQCDSCGLREWLGRRTPLELDHVNGDRRDNRLSNLRLLCPNCHALTPTYRGRNKGRYGG